MNVRKGPGISFSLFLFSALVLAITVYGGSGDAGTLARAYVPVEFSQMRGLDARDYEGAVTGSERADHISAYYADPGTRHRTMEFFEALTGGFDIAKAILDESTSRGIPPALAFALAYEESGFNPKAYNKNQSSIDRGLFQLNSASFPKLKLDEFYDVATNARHGVAHLEFCLRQGGNEVAALAIYNAGLGRVSKGGTPRATLNYIHRITGYRDRLEALFEAQVVARHSGTLPVARSAETAALAD